MGDYIEAAFYFSKFKDKESCNKAVCFLQKETRPDFSDDVDEEDQDFFKAVDEKLYPNEIFRVSDNSLIWTFDLEISSSDDEVFAIGLQPESFIYLYAYNDDLVPSFIVEKWVRGQVFSEIVFAERDIDDESCQEEKRRFSALIEEQFEKGIVPCMKWLDRII